MLYSWSEFGFIAPQDYEKTDRTGYGLEIFNYSTPAVQPGNSALYVLPPDNNPLTGLQAPVSQPVVSSWRDPHPLTRYVNFALFRPAFSRPLKPRVSGDVIIESSAGPLAFATERRGVRQLVLGFDLFPYLGRDNLPVSVFTLNLLDWFFQGSGVEGRLPASRSSLAPPNREPSSLPQRGQSTSQARLQWVCRNLFPRHLPNRSGSLQRPLCS